MQRDWRIVHIAAHGEPPELIGPRRRSRGDPRSRSGTPRGVVLSNEVYLGPREINSMRTVPELVFVNCCYLAARDLRQLFTKDSMDCEPRYRNDRPKFASGVAEALIKVGVRCVIAAGWAVEDDAGDGVRAHLLRGATGRAALHRRGGVARDAAWRLGGNTWAAYQCYGDPDWVFRRGVSDAQRPAARGRSRTHRSRRPAAWCWRCRPLRSNANSRRSRKGRARTYRNLEHGSRTTWGHYGRVAELFAIAYAKAGDERTAIEWYTKALRANDGGASVNAAEQRANLQVRLAWNAVDAALRGRERLKRRESDRRWRQAEGLTKAIAGATIAPTREARGDRADRWSGPACRLRLQTAGADCREPRRQGSRTTAIDR